MQEYSRLLKHDPNWRLRRKNKRYDIPSEIYSWIDEPGSLTLRLRAMSCKPVEVHIEKQAWAKAFLTEANLLDLPLSQRVWVREVLLHAEGLPLVLARTVIPSQMILRRGHGLMRLGDKPLGDLLFANKDLNRQSLELAKLDSMNWHTPVANIYPSNLPQWGRRSLYETRDLKLLVSEFFFTTLFNREMS